MGKQSGNLPSVKHVLDAAARIQGYAIRTPILTSSTLDGMFGTRLFFKCENFQKAGAFKFRGACNAVFSLAAKRCEKGRRNPLVGQSRLPRWRLPRSCAAFPAGW